MAGPARGKGAACRGGSRSLLGGVAAGRQPASDGRRTAPCCRHCCRLTGFNPVPAGGNLHSAGGAAAVSCQPEQGRRRGGCKGGACGVGKSLLACWLAAVAARVQHDANIVRGVCPLSMWVLQLEEGEKRLEVGLHYGIAYPRLFHADQFEKVRLGGGNCIALCFFTNLLLVINFPTNHIGCAGAVCAASGGIGGRGGGWQHKRQGHGCPAGGGGAAAQGAARAAAARAATGAAAAAGAWGGIAGMSGNLTLDACYACACTNK